MALGCVGDVCLSVETPAVSAVGSIRPRPDLGFRLQSEKVRLAESEILACP